MEKSFNTKKMIVNAILIAIGAVLHTISPTFGVAQPDFALAMLFIIILINTDYKTALFSGIIIGIFTAITTKTVGGQAPNIIDKVITANVAYLMLLPLRDKVSKNIQAALLLVVGTFVSGTVFLTSMMIFTGMPMKAIPAGLLSVVLPTACINVIIGIIIFNIVNQAIKQVHLNMN